MTRALRPRPKLPRRVPWDIREMIAWDAEFGYLHDRRIAEGYRVSSCKATRRRDGRVSVSVVFMPTTEGHGLYDRVTWSTIYGVERAAGTA